ncbi:MULTISPECIES: YheC/YheD family protein [Bacillales]|uniref:YheC/YheD family endospore coat-associated protein n=1 Tax=Bacillales TaxID=1385 RepID=UPI002377EE45|nr:MULTISPECIES: YheC/YheD family protein [Bacillales]MDR6883202.1 hypothetical protein [Bacillus sp. 3255]
MENPYVGILINDTLFDGIPQGKTIYEAIHYYSEAGKKYGVIPCYFRIQDVRIDSMKVRAYIPSGDKFVLAWIDLPKVIHNRAIYLDHASYDMLESWTQHGIILFNRWNRYSKLLIHQILLKDDSIRPHMPGTYAANLINLRMMMNAYDSLIIKPTNSSIGRGIMKMDRVGKGWNLIYPASMRISNRIWRQVRFSKQLPASLQKKLKTRSYIVQQCLPLAQYDGRPFDLRISVQRGDCGEWGITGIVAKVASRKHFLTNVAQGGEVMRLSDILAKEYPALDQAAVFQQITDFTMRVTKHLSAELPHLADIGLDIGLTSHGFPLFIECNSKDQRYSFKEADMMDEWKATFYKPIAYAKFLLDGGIPVY